MPNYRQFVYLLIFSFLIVEIGCGGGGHNPPQLMKKDIKPGDEIPNYLWTSWPQSVPPSLRANNPGSVTQTPILALPRALSLPQINANNGSNQTNNALQAPLSIIVNKCSVYMQWWSGVKLPYATPSDRITGISSAWKVDAMPLFSTSNAEVAVTASIFLDQSGPPNINFVQTGLALGTNGTAPGASFFVTNGANINKFGKNILVPLGDHIETWVEFKEDNGSDWVWEAWVYNQNSHKENYMGALSLPRLSSITSQEAIVLVDDIVEAPGNVQLPDAQVSQDLFNQSFSADFGGMGDNEAFWIKRGDDSWYLTNYSKAHYSYATFTHGCNTYSTDTNVPVDNTVEPKMGSIGKLIFRAGPGVTRTVAENEFNWKQ